MSFKCFLMLMTVIIAINKVTSQDEATTAGKGLLDKLADKLGIRTINPDINTDMYPGQGQQTPFPYTSAEEFCEKLDGNMKEWNAKSEGIGKSLACITFAIRSAYGQKANCPMNQDQRDIMEKAIKECPLQSEVFKNVLENSVEAAGHVIKASLFLILMSFLVLIVCRQIF